jgi:hypothetical protein
MTSKEIAQETGLAPQTIDTYLKLAMSRLDASSRRHAARLLTQYELSHKLGSPSETVAAAVLDCDDVEAAKRGWARILAPPPLGGTVNKLDPVQRTFAVLKVAAMSAAVVFALTLFITGMLATFR